MCCVSPLPCHMLLTSTARATDPPPANPPLWTAGCCCWSWPRPINNETCRFKTICEQKSQLHRPMSFHIFSLRIFFLNWTICLLTFVDGSIRPFKKSKRWYIHFPTNIATSGLNWLMHRFSENLIMYMAQISMDGDEIFSTYLCASRMVCVLSQVTTVSASPEMLFIWVGPT